jgi:hypothetical protein
MNRQELELLLLNILQNERISSEDCLSVQKTLKDLALIKAAENNQPDKIINQFDGSIDAVMIVHPRNQEDVFNRCSFFKNQALLGSYSKEEALEALWPLVLDTIQVRSKYSIPVITLPLAPDYWLPPLEKEKRQSYRPKMKILQARREEMTKILLALQQKLDFPIILGALTGRMIKCLTKKGVQGPFLTGNYLTPYLISEMIKRVAEIAQERLEDYQIALVGGAGSMGLNILYWLMYRDLEQNITVIDINREKLESVKEQFPGIRISQDIKQSQGKDIVIVATAAPQVLLKKTMLSKGTIVIDDTHPSNVTANLDQKDTVVLSVMADVPGIKYTFPISQIGDQDVVTCAAEGVVVLEAGFYETSGYIQTIKIISQLAHKAQELGISFAPFREKGKYVSDIEIYNIRRRG